MCFVNGSSVINLDLFWKLSFLKQATCNAIGRRNGTCSAADCDDCVPQCNCSNERLSPAKFDLCTAASTCLRHCQAGQYIDYE